MIVNVGGRTDIANYYSEWLRNRIKEGFAYSRNPLFPNNVSKVSLKPEDVDCLMFCSKNYQPILPYMKEISETYRVICHYTITAYGTDVEPNVPDIETSIQILMELSKIVGKEKVLWRYDPILLTQKYTVQKHLETFEKMAKQIAPYVERCIFSFVEMYKKHEVNFPELIPFTEEDKDLIAEGIGRIAMKYGFILQTCGPEENYAGYGINTSGCVTLDILGKANNLEFRNLKHKGFRKGCHCMESRDIGALNSCPNGCKYCYANKNAELPRENFRLHDPDSPLLIGHLKETDRLEPGAQKSFLAKRQGNYYA